MAKKENKVKTATSLCSDIQTFEFKRGQSQITLDIDLDSLTETYFRELGARHTKRIESGHDIDEKIPDLADSSTPSEKAKTVQLFWEGQAKGVTFLKELRADQLASGVIVGWDLTDEEGKPLPVEVSSFMQFSLRALNELWEFCQQKINGVG